MRPILTAVALALSLAGCGVLDADVPLLTRETATPWGGCVLDLHLVDDVIADPTSGAPIHAATGEAFTWPKGVTARRTLFEVEVLDPPR